MMEDFQRGTTRSGAIKKASFSGYTTSLKDVKYNHRHLYETSPVVTFVERNLGITHTLIVAEMQSRLLLGYQNIKPFLYQCYYKFKQRYSYIGSIQVSITANCIVSKTINNIKTFSVFYGEHFGSLYTEHSGESEQEHDDTRCKSCRLADLYYIRTASDVGSLPIEFDSQSVINIMQPRFTVSNVQIESVINLVYIFRATLSSKSAHKQP